MRTMKIVFASILILSVTSGCAQKMYYFGNYSETLYATQRDLNDESLLTHMQEIERIIKQSEELGKPVPPGIYAELGYYKLKSNYTKEAIELFKLEEQLYPESKILMTRLIQKAEAGTEKSKNTNTSNAVDEAGNKEI